MKPASINQWKKAQRSKLAAYPTPVELIKNIDYTLLVNISYVILAFFLLSLYVWFVKSFINEVKHHKEIFFSICIVIGWILIKLGFFYTKLVINSSTKANRLSRLATKLYKKGEVSKIHVARLYAESLTYPHRRYFPKDSPTGEQSRAERTFSFWFKNNNNIPLDFKINLSNLIFIESYLDYLSCLKDHNLRNSSVPATCKEIMIQVASDNQELQDLFTSLKDKEKEVNARPDVDFAFLGEMLKSKAPITSEIVMPKIKLSPLKDQRQLEL